MKKWLRNKLFYMWMFMFPLYAYEMDLGRLTEENERLSAEEESSAGNEEMLAFVNLPPIVEMKKLEVASGSIVIRKSPTKNINDPLSDSEEEGDEEGLGVEAAQEDKNQKHKELGSGLFGFLRRLVFRQ
jgi:hypothetical protein